MKECYVLLDDNEYKKTWDTVYKKLNFKPSTNKGETPFDIDKPFVVYDLTQVSEQNIDDFDEVISNTFSNCIGDDEYMYALDWQHSGFRYNPRIRIEQRSLYIKDECYQNGGYNAFFPDFFPDGDYYFFISINFDWGYLGHPWQQKVWVFGEKLIEEFEKVYQKIGFTKCS